MHRPVELRELSRLYRQEAREEVDPHLRRFLVSHAAALTLLAEKVEREPVSNLENPQIELRSWPIQQLRQRDSAQFGAQVYVGPSGGMSRETETADRCRLRATELRSKAATYKDREIGKAVLRVAEQYALLAHVFDGIDQAGLAAIRARNSN